MGKLKIKPAEWVNIVLVCTMLIFLAIMGYRYTADSLHETDQTLQLDFSGVYTDLGEENGLSIDASETVDAAKVNAVTLKGHFDNDIKDGEELIIYMYRINVEIYKNDEVIYSSGDADTARNTIMWDVFEPGEILSTDEITINMSSSGKGAYSMAYRDFLDNIYCGSAYNLALTKIKDNILQIVIAFLVFLVGFSMIITEFALSIMSITVPKESITSGLLLIAGGIGIFIDYDYINFISGNPYVVDLIDYITISCIFFLMVMHLASYIRQEKYKWLGEAITCAAAIIIIISYIMQMMGVSEKNTSIGNVFPILILIVVAEIGLLIVDIKTGKKRRRVITITASILLAAFIMLEMVYYWFSSRFIMYFFTAGFVWFAILEFFYTIRETKRGMQKAKAAGRLELELEQNKTAMLLSQIQPHFMNNAIASVQILCKEDSDKAYEALGHFAKFLRGNMNSITSSELVSYLSELEYVKNFVYLQKLRYEEELQVVYDTQYDDFYLPALSVQPLVENAIRYGVSQKEGVGTVTIRSWRETSGVYVSVEDDGAGFDEEQLKNDDAYTHRFHVGIANVKKRLAAKCNGTLTVESRPGEGTRATIFLPDELI